MSAGLLAAPLTAAVVHPHELGPQDVDHWSRLQREDPDLHSPFLGPTSRWLSAGSASGRGSPS